MGEIQRGWFFESIVSGHVFVLAVWYLNRPFLVVRFPQIAGDLGSDISTIGGKLAALAVSGVVAGIIISHLVDASIPLIIGDKAYFKKRHSGLKIVSSIFIRIFSIQGLPDPRVASVDRYLLSPRRKQFLALANDWAWAKRGVDDSEAEKIVLHQHITTRLRVISDSSRELFRDAYSEVMFSGSLFVTFVLLIPVSVAASLLNKTVETVPKHFLTDYLSVTLVIYLLAVLTCFLFKRRIRTFYGQALTLALHFHAQSKVRA